MLVLGIETSCDECAAAVVEDGRFIHSNIVASQIPFHEKWGGVVPEIASRKHIEWISGVVEKALSDAGANANDIDAAAATEQPGLQGSLLVGLSFARTFAFTKGIPFVPVNHLEAHLYAAQLSYASKTKQLSSNCAAFELQYPYLGLLVSGGHSLICKIKDFDDIEILGASLDDAAGEAFDKVGKHYGLQYPAGKYVDEMARQGDSAAYNFPMPVLHNGRSSDMSFSGLKNAAVNQLPLFKKNKEAGAPRTEDIIASFQRAAVNILLNALFKAVDETGINTVVTGGGVAANSYLRGQLALKTGIRAVFPPPELCGDNGAMVAGWAARFLSKKAKLDVPASASL